MKLLKKQIIGCTIITSILGQMVTLSAMGVWVGIISVATPFERAMAATNRFENIKNKYQTDDPNNNRGDDAKLNQTMTKYKNQSNPQPNLENKVIQKYYINNSQNSDEVDLKAYSDNGDDAKQRIEDSISIARQISQGATAPSTAANGAINTQYNINGVELSKSDSEGYSAKLDEKAVSSNPINQDEYTSAEINHSQTTFEGDKHYGDESKFYESGRAKLSGLKSGSASDATAYQTIQGIKEFNQPLEINPRSSLLNFGFKEVNDAVNGTGDWLSSCTDFTENVNHTYNSKSYTPHLCMKPAQDNQFFCEVERIYNVPHIVQSVAGNVSVTACGAGCVEVTFNPGEKNNDIYQSGDSCKVFTESAVIELNPNLQIDSVRVIDSSFDDHGIIKVNGQPSWSVIDGVYGSSGNWSGSCELKQNWESSSHQGNLESVLKNTFNKMNGVIGLSMLTRVSNGGGGYFKFRVKLSDPDGDPFGISYKQFPAGCYDAVASEYKETNGLLGLGEIVDVGQVGGNVSDGSTATSNYPYSLCRFDSYTNLKVGDGNLPPTLLKSVPAWYNGDIGNKTWRVNLDGFRCDPTGGYDYCVVTKLATDEEREQGIEDETECYNWDEIKSQPNQCQSYEEDEQCTLIEKTCAEGWKWDRPNGQDDVCFAYTVEYQCAEETSHIVTTQKVSNSCASTLPCVGGNCNTANSEQNDQFVDALAMASVIQHMEDGMNCTDPADPTTCEIFEGEGKFCSWEPTGLGNDCCEAPDGIDIYEYAKAAYSVLESDAFIAGLDGTSNAFVGGYQSLRQPIADVATSAGQAASNAWGAASSAFTDAASSAVGSSGGQVADSTGTVLDIFSDEAIGVLKQQTMNYVRDALPEELANALFDTVATDAAGQAAGDAVLSEGANQAVAVLGYVYMAYMIYQYIKLALSLLTACHEYEMDMGVRIATKQCIQVGEKYCAKDGLGVCYIRRQDYCCYDSILSRIIMEQASPMLGHSLETYTNEEIDGSTLRSCPGLTPNQLANLDWNRIDLSEWVGIMIESGIADFDQDMEKLTGSGRMINNIGRDSAAERTKNRVNEADLADRAVEARKLLDDDNVDCSYVPRPLSCYFE